MTVEKYGILMAEVMEAATAAGAQLHVDLDGSPIQRLPVNRFR